MVTETDMPKRRKIAEFRYSIIGSLFSSPPEKGKLAFRLRELAELKWTLPGSNISEHFSVRTLERWYGIAKKSPMDPIVALLPAQRSDVGKQLVLTNEHLAWLRDNYRNNPTWSWRLHADNLADTGIKPVASYTTVLRWMKKHSLIPKRGISQRRSHYREIKLYEALYSGELWHCDAHHGSRKILHPNGEYVTPMCIAFIDDRSRLIAHCQWFLGESSEELIHTCIQAILKRGMPRRIMSDNGSAMTSAEFSTGLRNLAIEHCLTQKYSPHQNGKIESFWNPLEGRLMKMLAKIKPLTLDALNQYTQAWVEEDYNNKRHSETGEEPIKRYLSGADVVRGAPDYEKLTRAFRMAIKRTVRRTDGTVTIDAVRFEVPSHLRHLNELTVAYARWNLSSVTVLDPDTHIPVADMFPVDLNKNANGRRTIISSVTANAENIDLHNTESHVEQLPPTLARCVREYSAKSSLSGYIPLERTLKK